MQNTSLKNILFFPLILLFLSFASLLFAQDIEGATREVDRLGREKEALEKQIRRPPQKEAGIIIEEPPAAGREQPEVFFIKKISLTGCESFPAESFYGLTAKYENKEASLVDLDILAKDIEQEYLKRGVIAAVFIPPQDIQEGNVSLQVVEAKMGELRIEDHKYFSKKRLSYYWQIQPGDVLRYDKISKSLKMMSKNPDREVKSTLAAGKSPGTTDVVLIPEAFFPAHLVASYDKEGIVSSGRSRYTFGMRHNNFLGLDDMLLTGYTFGREFSGSYAYHNIPVSPFGTSLIYGYSQSRATPKKDYSEYGIRSVAKNMSLSLYQDLYAQDNYFGEVYLGFDAKDKTIAMNTGTYNRDRLRILRLGSSLNFRGMGGLTNISYEFSQGLRAFGASPRDNPLASRGAKPGFNKFTLGAQHRQNLPLDLQANLKFRSQFTRHKLAPQEEFSLGGINTVRGYPPDDYLADNAVLTSAELLIPSIFIPQDWRIPYDENTLRQNTTLVAFMDYGHGSRVQPSGSERKSKDLLSIGAGVRFSLFNQALLRLEWGMPLAANRSISESGDSRFHFAVDFKDQLPQEIERIGRQMRENRVVSLAWLIAQEELSRPDSAIRQELESSLSLARARNRQGELNEARQAYAKVLELSMSLYKQSYDYAKDAVEKEEEMADYRRRAVRFSRMGRLEEAKKEWERIAAQEELLEPVVFKF